MSNAVINLIIGCFLFLLVAYLLAGFIIAVCDAESQQLPAFARCRRFVLVWLFWLPLSFCSNWSVDDL